MRDLCHSCGLGLSPQVYLRIRGNPEPQFADGLVWIQTTLGRIALCHRCYEADKFDDLTSEDVGEAHYAFSAAYNEDVPDRTVSLKRLQKAFALCPCPEIEGALGYAHWKLGNTTDAVRHCRASLTQQSNHFGASKAHYVLQCEDPDCENLTRQLLENGRRIKAVAEEFPCDPICSSRPAGGASDA